MKRWKCSLCQRQFRNEHAVANHAKDKHPGKKAKPVENVRPKRDDDEPSMAELFIEAQMNRAMGIRNEDWIEDMLP